MASPPPTKIPTAAIDGSPYATKPTAAAGQTPKASPREDRAKETRHSQFEYSNDCSVPKKSGKGGKSVANNPEAEETW